MAAFGTVLITGASSGIGAALARACARPDATLHLAGRNADRLAAVASACRALGATVLPRSIDVRDAGAMAAGISAAGRLDLVVANADINNPATPNLLFEISPALGFVGTPLPLDTSGTAGALFGVVATVDTQGNQIIYFNDDNTNTVNMLSH